MATLSQLIAEYDADGFVYCDAGNGAAYGEGGQFVRLDITDPQYADVVLTALDEPNTSDDGVECNYASDWIVSGTGDNPYRYRVMF